MIEVVDSERYFVYKNPNGKFSVNIKYIDGNGKYHERCVRKNICNFDDVIIEIKHFEESVNYDELVAKKHKEHEWRSEFTRKRNLDWLALGIHQFQTNPEIQNTATDAALEWWKKHPELKSEMCRTGMATVWKNKEHVKKMRKILKANNDSGKTKDGLHRMLADPIRREAFIKSQSEASKKKWKDPVYRENVINGLLTAMENGDWEPPYTRAIRGWHYSRKNGKSHFYRSAYELLMYKNLDSLDNVVGYDTECIRVRYMFEGDFHYTLPDIFIEFTDGRMVILEIKSEYYLSDSRTQAKIRAGSQYAKEHDMGYLLVTESEMEKIGLFGDPSLSNS